MTLLDTSKQSTCAAPTSGEDTMLAGFQSFPECDE